MASLGSINTTTDMLTNDDAFAQNVGVLSRTGSINLKVAATTNLYTVPSARVAVVTSVIIRVTAATAFTVAPTAGIGIAAGESDIMQSTSLLGLIILGGLYGYSCEGYFVSGVASDIIKLGINVGATATTATGEVTLIGYLI